MNYQMNVGSGRGLVMYYIHLLEKYIRNVVMNIFVTATPPEMTICDDFETYKDVTLVVNLTNNRGKNWILCEQFSDIVTEQTQSSMKSEQLQRSLYHRDHTEFRMHAVKL